ncbi:MAG: hypothetical protein ACE5LS_07190 [Thermoplasmata archaeon]
MDEFPLERAVQQAREALEEYGYPCEADSEDLRAYFDAETVQDDRISMGEVATNRFLLMHELVEITEIKRLGLELTKDVIVQNYELVYGARLKAAEVELEQAALAGDHGHLRRRLEDVRSWCEDPLLPAAMKARCEDLRSWTESVLS